MREVLNELVIGDIHFHQEAKVHKRKIRIIFMKQGQVKFSLVRIKITTFKVTMKLDVASSLFLLALQDCCNRVVG